MAEQAHHVIVKKSSSGTGMDEALRAVPASLRHQFFDAEGLANRLAEVYPQTFGGEFKKAVNNASTAEQKIVAFCDSLSTLPSDSLVQLIQECDKFDTKLAANIETTLMMHFLHYDKIVFHARVRLLDGYLTYLRSIPQSSRVQANRYTIRSVTDILRTTTEGQTLSRMGTIWPLLDDTPSHLQLNPVRTRRALSEPGTAPIIKSSGLPPPTIVEVGGELAAASIGQPAQRTSGAQRGTYRLPSVEESHSATSEEVRKVLSSRYEELAEKMLPGGRLGVQLVKKGVITTDQLLAILDSDEPAKCLIRDHLLKHSFNWDRFVEALVESGRKDLADMLAGELALLR